MTIFDYVCEALNVKMLCLAGTLTKEQASLRLTKIITKLPKVSNQSNDAEKAHRKTILKTWVELNK